MRYTIIAITLFSLSTCVFAQSNTTMQKLNNLGNKLAVAEETAKADADAKLIKTVTEAIYNCDVQTVKANIKTAADANLFNADLQDADFLNLALDSDACDLNKGGEGYQIVNHLLAKGANKDLPSNNITPFQLAAKNYDTAVLLLQYGADYTANPSNGPFLLPLGSDKKVSDTLRDLVCVLGPVSFAKENPRTFDCHGIVEFDRSMGPGYYDVQADNGSRLKPQYNYIMKIKYASKGKSKLKTKKYQYFN